MQTIQQEIQVSFRFPVHFTTGLFDTANPLLKRVVEAAADHLPTRVVFVVDEGVTLHRPALFSEIEKYCEHYHRVLKLVAPPIPIPGGEAAKNDPRYADEIVQVINAGGLCRHSYVVAVGGGALLDVAGYAAATAHRGIRLIRVPTTALAQDDSGVGVKNGINAFGKKNYLGTFVPPAAVINDFDFIRTLPDRDWRCGIAEAVKVALIKDASFFDYLEQHADALVRRDPEPMQKMIWECARLHLHHIANCGDPFEMGSSRPLDFGHWSAHKLEQLSNYRIRHGEAVAIGMALDSTYSHLAGHLAEEDWRRIIDLLLALGLPISAPELSDNLEEEHHPRSVWNGLNEFREHLGGMLTILLLQSIGKAFDVHEVNRELMIRSVGILNGMGAVKV